VPRAAELQVGAQTVEIASPELKERFFSAAQESPGGWLITAMSLRAAAARLDWLTAPVRDDESSAGSGEVAPPRRQFPRTRAAQEQQGRIRWLRAAFRNS